MKASLFLEEHALKYISGADYNLRISYFKKILSKNISNLYHDMKKHHDFQLGIIFMSSIIS